MGVDSAALIKTLNKTCLDALQGAAGLCVSRTNYNVELEHWLLKLSEIPNGDLTRIYKHYDVDTSHLLRDLTRAIDRFKTGNARTPALAPTIELLIREAWIQASIQFEAAKIRSAVLLLALLSEGRLGRQALEASRELAKIGVESLSANLMKIVAGSAEEESATAERAAAARRPPAAAGRRARPRHSTSTRST